MDGWALLIDGGTTHTRFTLVHDGAGVASVSREVGASDAAGENPSLERAVGEVISGLETAHGCRIGAAVASGMITSEAGLREVPHRKAPAALDGLAAAAEPVRLPKVAPHTVFWLVPGVCFPDGAPEERDVLRGEETEIYGALRPADADKTLLFAHFGSHCKLIRCRAGRIDRSVTTIGGELFGAVSRGTILRESLAGDVSGGLLPDWVGRGYEAAESLGFSRALFLTRVNRLMGGASARESFSYLHGVLAQADCRAFAPLLAEGADELVLYGRDRPAEAYRICLGRFFRGGIPPLRVIPFEESEQLSVRGLRRICRELPDQPRKIV